MDEEKSEREVPLSSRIPQRISEGMPVYDREGEAIGVVKVVYLGGASDEAIQRVLHPETAPADQPGASDWSIFEADGVPADIRAHLMMEGFIMVEGRDLAGRKRYVGPEQIEGVFTQDVEGGLTDAVRLRVARSELLGP